MMSPLTPFVDAAITRLLSTGSAKPPVYTYGPFQPHKPSKVPSARKRQKTARRQTRLHRK